MPLCTVDKLRPLFGHRLFVLLTHRATHHIGLCQCEAGECLHELHYLLLVHDDTVGLFENRTHQGVEVLDRLTAVLAINEVRDIAHRSRTVERVHRNEVIQHCRLKLT